MMGTGENRLCGQDQAAVRLWPRTIIEARRMAASHVARYVFAERFAAGGKVCDVACGVGYGSFYLSHTAGEVVGMDISSEAIDWADRFFSQPNVRFFAADGCQPWPVTGQFDLITSFETLEHVQRPEVFLKQLYDHLLPGGRLVLSVPNGPRDLMKTDNPHHIHHFSASDLEALISGCFAGADYYSQAYRKDFRHYGTKFLRKAKVLKKQPYFVGNFFFKAGLSDDVKTWLLTATK